MKLEKIIDKYGGMAFVGLFVVIFLVVAGLGTLIGLLN